jgi:hypothetical protein
MQCCQAASGRLWGALGEPQAGVGDDQPHVSEAALLEMLEEGATAGPVLLGALADAENLPIVLAVHADRHQQRHVADEHFK